MIYLYKEKTCLPELNAGTRQGFKQKGTVALCHAQKNYPFYILYRS